MKYIFEEILFDSLTIKFLVSFKFFTFVISLSFVIALFLGLDLRINGNTRMKKRKRKEQQKTQAGKPYDQKAEEKFFGPLSSSWTTPKGNRLDNWLLLFVEATHSKAPCHGRRRKLGIPRAGAGAVAVYEDPGGGGNPPQVASA